MTPDRRARAAGAGGRDPRGAGLRRQRVPPGDGPTHQLRCQSADRTAGIIAIADSVVDSCGTDQPRLSGGKPAGHHRLPSDGAVEVTVPAVDGAGPWECRRREEGVLTRRRLLVRGAGDRVSGLHRPAVRLVLARAYRPTREQIATVVGDRDGLESVVVVGTVRRRVAFAAATIELDDPASFHVAPGGAVAGLAAGVGSGVGTGDDTVGGIAPTPVDGATIASRRFRRSSGPTHCRCRYRRRRRGEPSTPESAYVLAQRSVPSAPNFRIRAS